MRESRASVVSVVAAEAVGPYTLVRVERGGLDPGVPGQFFMLEAPGRVLPRPMTLCLAPAGELAFLVDPIGPGTRALVRARAGRRARRVRAARQRLRPRRRAPLLVGGGIGDRAAAVPVRGARRSACRARLPHRAARRGGGARAERRGRVEPTLVTELMPAGHDVLACGPEPMLDAVRALAPGRAARVGGADGVRLRRLLRLRGRDRRRAEAPLRRGPGADACSSTLPAASTRSRRPTSRGRSTRS